MENHLQCAHFLECAKFLGKLSAGLFAGGSLYITLVHHPAIVETKKDSDAVDQFCSLYKRAAFTQGIYILTGVSCNSLVYRLKGDKNYLYSALFLLAVPPFTRLAMVQTNNALNGMPEKLKNSDQSAEAEESILSGARDLIAKWGKLHAVRSILGIAAVSVIIYKS